MPVPQGFVPVTQIPVADFRGLSVLTGIFGLAALFLDSISTLLPTAGDALAGTFLIAGGISWAVAMKGAACVEQDVRRLYLNPLLNQGCSPGQEVEGMPICGVLEGAGASPEAWWSGTVRPICQRAYANETFLFLGFAVSLVLIGLDFLMGKRKGERPRFAP